LNTYVTEQELDLRKFPASLMTQAGTGASLMPHAALCRAFLAQRRGARDFGQVRISIAATVS
jgi:hypothetical protein